MLGEDADAIHTSLPAGANGDELSEISVTDCTFTNIGQRCMKFQSGWDLLVENNTAENCNQFVSNALQFDTHTEVIRNNTVSNTTNFFAVSTFPGDNLKISNLLIELNRYYDGMGFIHCWGDGAMGKTTIQKNNVFIGDIMKPDIKEAIFSGRGEFVNITDNNFVYENSETTTYHVDVTDGGYVKIERNTFKSINSDNDVIYIRLVGNVSGEPIQYNIIRDNIFLTQYDPDNHYLVHPNTYLEETNIIEID